MITAPDGYTETVRAMSDEEYEAEVTSVTGMAAHSTTYCVWDARAAVLREDRQHRPDGDELYDRGHRRMVAGVWTDRAITRALDRADTYINA